MLLAKGAVRAWRVDSLLLLLLPLESDGRRRVRGIVLRHQPTKDFEYDLELPIAAGGVLLHPILKGNNTTSQVSIGGEDMPDADEGAHDLDVDGNRSRTIEHS